MRTLRLLYDVKYSQMPPDLLGAKHPLAKCKIEMNGVILRSTVTDVGREFLFNRAEYSGNLAQRNKIGTV